MRRVQLHDIDKDMASIDPIVRLWLLRLLVPLECRRQLIGITEFDNDEIALLFALPGAASISQFDAGKARLKLYRSYQATEKQAAKLSLPTLLADNIERLADLVGLSDVECQLLGFAVLLSNNRLLNEASVWLGGELSTLKV